MIAGTFSEDDVRKFKEFLKFIVDHGRWDNITTSQAFDLNKYFLSSQELMKKMNDNILEVKKVTEARATEAQAADVAAKADAK